MGPLNIFVLGQYAHFMISLFRPFDVAGISARGRGRGGLVIIVKPLSLPRRGFKRIAWWARCAG